MSTRINRATNPSAALAVTNFAATPGTGGTAAIAYNAGTGQSGVGFARTTWTVATSAVSGGCTYTQTGLSASTAYAASVWVKASKAQTLQLSAVYQTAVPATVNTVVGTAVAVLANTWTQLTAVGTSGAAVTQVVLQVAATTGSTNWAAADTLDIDAVLIEAAAAVGTYFDGASASAAWNGTANASTSTLYIPVLTLTQFNDSNPCPRVLVAMTDFAPNVQTVTVTRVAEGRTMKVRGGVALFAIGGAQVMDYETPFGILASYRAEQFDTSGQSLGFTNATTTTLAVTDTWISQPLSPTLAVKVKVFLESGSDLVRPSPGGMFYPEGATVGRLIGGQRQGIQGATIRVRVLNAADSDELGSMFGSYSSDFPSVLLIRTPVTIRLPAVLFAGCLDPHEVSYGNYAMITWQMTVNEVSPPSPGLIIPTLRRNDIDFAFATRTARAAAYATRLARDSDYSKAGLSGP